MVFVTEALMKADILSVYETGKATAPADPTKVRRTEVKDFLDQVAETIFAASPTTADALYVIAPRGNATTGVQPTAGELQAANGGTAPTLADGDDAEIVLNDGTLETWEYRGAVWTLKRTIAPGAAVVHNFTPIVDPTVNEDSADGYAVSSWWYNTANTKLFLLVDSAVGAAVWYEIASGGDNQFYGTLAAMDTGFAGQKDGDETEINSGLMDGATFTRTGSAWAFASQVRMPRLTTILTEGGGSEAEAIGTRLTGTQVYWFKLYNQATDADNGEYVIDSAGVIDGPYADGTGGGGGAHPDLAAHEALGLVGPAVASTGNILLDKRREYGTMAAPLTGDLTVDLTGAVRFGQAVIFHQEGTAPTITVAEPVLETTGTYSTTELNAIFFTRVTGGVIVSYASGVAPPAAGSPVNTVIPAITSRTAKAAPFANLDRAYPEEVLTSDDGTWSNAPTGFTYQWFVDNVAVGGATTNTFTPTVQQSGLGVRCEVVASNAIGAGAAASTASENVWIPYDVTGVDNVLAGWQNVRNIAGGADATNGQTVAEWVELTGGSTLEQLTGTDRPTFDSTAAPGGLPAVTFNGTNDRVLNSTVPEFSSVPLAYVWQAAEDTNAAGGTLFHITLVVTIGNTSLIQLSTQSSGSTIRLGGRRVTGDAFQFAETAYVAGWNVIGGLMNYTAGTIDCRLNGVSAAVGTIASTGNTAATAPELQFGSNGSNVHFFPGNISCAVTATPAALLSAKDIARIERWVGLHAGKDIPLNE